MSGDSTRRDRIADELNDRNLLARSLTRRTVLIGSTAVVTGGLLAACGGGSAEPTPAGSSAGASTATTSSAAPQATATTAASGAAPTTAAQTAAPTKAPVKSSIEELVVALGEDTTVMDPDFDQGLNDMYRLIFNTPITTSDSDEPVPDLATSWSFTNDTTLVIKLRQDATWQDGTPITSEDFVYTWQRMSSPDRKSTNFPRYKPWLKDVVAVDKYTVQFLTNAPYAPAVVNLDGFWLAPKHDIEKRGDKEFGLKPLGSGPYRVVEWQKDQFLKLEAVPNWWGGAQPFPKVRFVIIPDTFARTTAMLSGQAHIVSEPPAAMISQIESSSKYYVARSPGSRMQFIQFPHVGVRHPDTPEIDNKLVRQALNYALDRDAIVKAVGQSLFNVVPGPWPADSWAYPPDAAAKGYHYDPNKAKQLLTEAGYPNGFTLYFGTSKGFSLMDSELMQACVPYFQAIGLKVEFTALEWAAFDPARDQNKFSIYYLGLTGDVDPDGSITFYMTSTGRKRGFYGTDPKIDEVIWAGPKILNFEQRKKYYQETVFPTLIDIAPWIFLWTPTNVFGVDKRLEYKPGPQGFVEVMRLKVLG